jgi:flagellar basal-body rod modification protein FlgD
MPSISTSPVTTTSATGTGLQGTTDEFLKLFMAQLQQQDPFNPTSGADMVSQLAQLSAVEQAKQTNTELSDISASQSSEASAGLSSLIGRNCSATAGNFQISTSGSTPPPVAISSTTPTSGATIEIDDANGKAIRTIPIPDGSTSTSVQWDGKDANGAAVPPGSYKMVVNPGKGSGTIDAQWSGRVDAVELTANGPELRMGDVLIAPSDVRTIGNTTATANAVAKATAISNKIATALGVHS